ncbi:MAG: hypothetical protein HW416_3997, partial [Chloroflexi bacterium]|nr:hypothetical protein [Chloroflexota bacterium]
HYDERGELHPMMATELPSQEKGTWLVRADGTMQTTFRLRDGITWHDGAPLTARDFVFGWMVTKDPEIPMSRRTVAPQIERIDTPDDRTLMIEWASTYPFANALVEDEIGPMPVHLTGSVYQTDKERFVQLGYWTREFVGVGPYRLAEWEAGSHLTLQAYQAFYAGRARIDTLIFHFIPSGPTAVANMLAGTLDGVIPRTLDFNQVMFVKAEFERAGKKPLVTVDPTHWRMLDVQARAEMVKPRDLLDVRVRRALLSATDRQALVDTLLAGTIPYSDTLVAPGDVKWEWVQDVIIRYPYDPRRAQQLLEQVGWRRGQVGPYSNAAGEQMTLDIRTQQGDLAEMEQNIIADNWRSAGLTVEHENSVASIFPAFHASAGPLSFDHLTTRLHSRGCSSEANRWTGPNHGCAWSAESDKTIDALLVAIDAREQRRLWRDFVQYHTDQLPMLPLYFNPQSMIFREGVTGVKGETRPRTSPTWNVAEWDVR